MTTKNSTTKEAARKVVALVRVSSKGQAKDDKMGLKAQRDSIEALKDLHNLQVVEEVALKGVSGASIQHSELYKTNLMNVLKRDDVCGVCFAYLDRLFRPEDISTFGDVFKPIIALKADKRLFCDLGEINFNDPNDNLKLIIWGGMAHLERHKIRIRTKRGNELKAALPDSCTKKLPEGVVFKRHDERVNSGVFGFTEYARTVVVKAFKRTAAGDPLMRIVHDMVDEAAAFGIKIGAGNGYGNFSTKSLRDTLQSRWWLGEKPNGVKANFAAWVDPKHGTLTSEPIITEQLWQTVQDRLKHNTDADNWTKQNPIKGDFLAAGIMFCGECGSKMYHKYKKDGRTGKYYAIYVCSSRERGFGCMMPRVQAHTSADTETCTVKPGIDDLLACELERLLTNPNFLADRLQEARNASETDERKIELAVSEKTVRELERKKENFETAIGTTDNGSVIVSLTKKLEEIDGELSEARLKVRLAKKGMDSGVDMKAAVTYVKNTFVQFSALPKAEQIALLQKYVSRIVYRQPVADGGLFNLDVELKVTGDQLGQSDTETAACFTFSIGLTRPENKPPLQTMAARLARLAKAA